MAELETCSMKDLHITIPVCVCVCVCVGCMCMCVCSEAKDLHPKPKRQTHSHINLSDAHSTRQFSCLELNTHMPMHTHARTRTHTHHLSAFSAVKSSLSLPAVSFNLRALSCYFVKALRLTGICFTSKVFSPPSSSRAEAELRVSASGMCLLEK